MPDEIVELRELTGLYRRRSTSPITPIADAYAEAADHLEDILAGVRRPAPFNEVPNSQEISGQ